MPSEHRSLPERVADRASDGAGRAWAWGARFVPAWLGRLGGSGRDRLDAALGGPARRQVILVLTSVLALAVADQGALSATADAIQSTFGITKARFGVLGSITTGVSAVATLPFGVYVDRVVRTRLLGTTIVLWAVAMVVSGFATSFWFLLSTRVFLGVVVAVAYPAVASLIGDYFPPAERGRVYGYVLAGELLGTGIGLVLAALVTSAFGTWRAAMVVLALPALAVIWMVLRLPEPARGGASRMPRGQQEILSARRVEEGAEPDAQAQEGESSAQQDLAEEQVRRRDVEAQDELVLVDDPSGFTLLRAVRYILSVRTNAVVIVASALGYFFFSGLRLFGIQFIEHHYGISRSQASGLVLVIGAASVAGVVVGGPVADRLLKRGRVSARVLVPVVTFVVSAFLFAPGIVTSSVGIALALILPGAFLFAASNPPLDAARLDVMPHTVWGRAESVRSMCRGALEAAAPITFGMLATHVFGGLERTFLVMLVPLVVAGLILLVAVRTYPRDVASARASERSIAESEEASSAGA